MAIKAIINNIEKEIEQIKNSDEQDIDYVYSRIGDTEVEGEPPISIKSVGGNLADYRIYGNTVDGESVGDRTGNLFDGEWEQGSFNEGLAIGTPFQNTKILIDSPFYNKRVRTANICNIKENSVISFNDTKYSIYIMYYDADSCYTGNHSNWITTSPYIINASNVGIAIKRKSENLITPDNVADINFMLNAGSTALPYEPYGYRIPVTTERSVPHTATLQLHDCLPSTMQFDAPEALYYAENGLTAGTYNFTIHDSYDIYFGGGKTYQFTLANDVPAKGQLVFGWDYNTQASAAKITSYASSTSTTAIEQVGVTEGSGGTSLGTTDGNSTNVNHIHRARYGSNNYKESAIRQFLNSSAVAGSVWTPQTKYDRPPSWNSNTAGFMKDIDSDFLAVLGASPKVVALNTVTDGGGSVTINNDKFFLLSRSEVYGGKENNINEGEPYPYYSNYSDLSAAGTGDDSNRIKYRSDTAQIWWLRSPYSASGGTVRHVNTSGSVYDSDYAYNSCEVAPACNIALDEDYKFNGRVLHVRDQISVQKGNQTLVFDVIGIDHDEVHFDKTTVDIYLPEQIRKVGDEAEYISYSERKLHRVGADDIDVTLPALSTIKGTNTFSVNTSIQPSNIYIKDNFDYKKVFTATRTIEGESPLNYRSIEDSDSTLNNYRIYGQTVDGESVGDRTGNLWGINGTVAFSNDVSVKSKDSEFIIQSSGINGTVSAKSPQYQNKFKLHLTAGTYTYSYRYNGTSVGIVMGVYTIEGEALNSNFTLLNDTDIYIGFYIPPKTTCNQRWMFMLNTGSTALPYEPYGYKVPVTVEGKNLFDEVYPNIQTSSSTTVLYKQIYVGAGEYTLSTLMPTTSQNYTNLFFIAGYVNDGANTTSNGVNANTSRTISSTDGYITIGYRNFDNVSPRDYPVILNSGSTPLPYEPYHAPVTTPIYLPEQIKKVGDYSDYIDYGSQKFVHRVVRKVFDGTEQFNYNVNNNTIDYIVPTITMMGGATLNCTSNHIPALSGDILWQKRNIPDAQYISAFYQNNSSKIRFIWNDNNGVMKLSDLKAQLSTWYANGDPLIVDYIIEAPVEEQVTLPALPTVTGTNVLSVGTEVQSSGVEIKGHIK